MFLCGLILAERSALVLAKCIAKDSSIVLVFAVFMTFMVCDDVSCALLLVRSVVSRFWSLLYMRAFFLSLSGYIALI